MTTVANIRDYTPHMAREIRAGLKTTTHVYIGRPSKWGNPFPIYQHSNRDDVIAKYKAWLCWENELYDAIHTELAGKVLVCWCAPLACHGDVLAAIAEGDLVLWPK